MTTSGATKVDQDVNEAIVSVRGVSRVGLIDAFVEDQGNDSYNDQQ
jgi:hypothetical protein